MTRSAAPLDVLLAEFRATYPVAELRHEGDAWRYRRGGVSANPVLWLTGALGVGDFAFAHALALGTDFRIIVPDYPPVRTLDRMADGLVAILDAERIGAAHVVGGSFGGMVAQHFVRRHPERVRSLVLSHTAAPDPSHARAALIHILSLLLPARPYRALFSRRLRPAFVVGDPFWLRYFDATVARLTKADLVSKAILLSEFLQCGYRPGDLERWPGWILVLDADDDQLMPGPTRAALRTLYPRAEVHTFSGTGHSTAILHPERYADVIRCFLRSGTA
ncbi:MAG: alpha/beta hydrolase [Gemmatimonadetes bacterium]|nr:alpha/beta hydrolase [Gemmatimonadota bacterium]